MASISISHTKYIYIFVLGLSYFLQLMRYYSSFNYIFTDRCRGFGKAI